MSKTSIGMRYGRLIVTARGKHNEKHLWWACRCDCGTDIQVRGDALRSGKAKSCGCYAKEIRAAEKWRDLGSHGMSRTSLHNRWKSMRARCHNPNNPSFPRYGGRGITVCDEWRRSFEAFRDHVGVPPPGMTLDRIDNNRGYEPGNVRWASASLQVQNSRKAVLNWDIVRQIREMSRAGARNGQIARTLNMKTEAVWKIVHGKHWREDETRSVDAVGAAL